MVLRALLPTSSKGFSKMLAHIPLSFFYRGREERDVRTDMEIPEWISTQVQSDLAPFKESGITQAALDGVMAEANYSEAPQLVRYQIRGGRVFIHSYRGICWNWRVLAVTRFLAQLSNRAEIPDVDFIISLHDSFTRFSRQLLLKGPVFAFAKHKEIDNRVVLIPDFEAMSGYSKLLTEVYCGRQQHPWHLKRPKLVWRGASTGGYYDWSNYTAFPRFQLVSLGRRHPERVDAKFSQLCQMDEKLAEKLKNEGYVGECLSIAEHLKYKYQILIDGNSCAYSRAYWQLFSNSLILKQESADIQWYYGALAPYAHYIPVANDLSDLVSKLEWAENNPSDGERMIRNANQFAAANLHEASTALYVIFLLREYSKMQS